MTAGQHNATTADVFSFLAIRQGLTYERRGVDPGGLLNLDAWLATVPASYLGALEPVILEVVDEAVGRLPCDNQGLDAFADALCKRIRARGIGVQVPVPGDAGVELRDQPGVGRTGAQLQRLVESLEVLPPPTGHQGPPGAVARFAGVDHAVWHWFLADGRDVQLMLVDADGLVHVDLDVFRRGGWPGPYEVPVLSASGVAVGDLGRVLGQVRLALADVGVPPGPVYDAVQRPIRTDHASIDSDGRLSISTSVLSSTRTLRNVRFTAVLKGAVHHPRAHVLWLRRLVRPHRHKRKMRLRKRRGWR